MTPSSGPILPNHIVGPSRVIQGRFPGGKPRVLQPSLVPAAPVRPPAPAPFQARPASAPAPILPGRPANGALQPARPGQPPRPILPTNHLQPRSLQPAAPVRPQVPQPILPQRAATGTLQPSGGNAFALPANFALKPRGSGQPLPEPIQRKMESFFNTSFADVRVHVGPEASAIGALAFTHGTDLYFAPGQYNPQSSQGQQLLGHELTHVVQQRAGRVRNPLGVGVAVVQDPALEAEAERMGLRAATTSLPIQAKSAGTGPVVVPLRDSVSGPITVATNGAILPACPPAQATVQRKSGPILPGGSRTSGKEMSLAPFPLARFSGAVQRMEEKPGMDGRLLEIPRLDLSGIFELTPEANLSGWSSGIPELKNADHKAPKSLLAWLFEHMGDDDKDLLRKTLFLSSTSGVNSIARLRSNLISARTSLDPGGVVPDKRTDDPHHNRDVVPKEEAGLDLVHTTGSPPLSPRSGQMHRLAQYVVNVIIPRYTMSGDKKAFLLTHEEAANVIGFLRLSEAYHYEIEPNPLNPSHHAADDIWARSEGGRFFKKRIDPIPVGDPDKVLHSYEKKKALEWEQYKHTHDTRIQITAKWLAYLLTDPKTTKDEDIHVDALRGHPLYIHGLKKGRYVIDPNTKLPYNDFSWLSKLKDITEGRLDPDDVEWFELLFTTNQ